MTPRFSDYGMPGAGAFDQAFASDPMLSAAKQIGGQFAEQQKEKVLFFRNPVCVLFYAKIDQF